MVKYSGLLTLCISLFLASPYWTSADNDRPSMDAEDRPENATEPAEPRIRFQEEIHVVGNPIIDSSRLSSLGNEIVSVSARQIEDLHAQDFASALRRVPGVVISRYNMISFRPSNAGTYYSTKLRELKATIIPPAS